MYHSGRQWLPDYVALGDDVDWDRDDDAWLIEHAKRLCDGGNLTHVGDLAKCTVWLRQAIERANPRSTLRRDLVSARGRVFGVLAKRNEECVVSLIAEANTALSAAARELSCVENQTGDLKALTTAFDIARQHITDAQKYLSLLRTRDYFKPYVRSREAEVALLESRCKELSSDYAVKRPELIRTARDRQETAAQLIQLRKQQAEDAVFTQRIEAIQSCRSCMEAGDLAGAKLWLSKISPLKMKPERKSVGWGYNFVPDDPVLAELEARLLELSVAEARRLKAMVDELLHRRDFERALQPVALAMSLDPRSTEDVFCGQLAMIAQRCRIQARGTRRV